MKRVTFFYMRWLPVLLLLVGCLDPLAPKPWPAPAGTVSLTPPSEYAGYWSHMEDCSGIHAPFTRLAFFMVPGGGFSCPSGSCDGMWSPAHNLYLAHLRMDDSLLVEHEMLHDLIQRGDHPPVFVNCGVR